MGATRLSFVSFILFFACGGVSSYMVGLDPYHRVESLDPEGHYRLEWKVDLHAQTVVFNVTVETTGYIGFGLSARGLAASGADIVIGGVGPNGKSYFSDRHSLGDQIPEVDASQDWDLISAFETGHHTHLSFSRVFDTCDKQDYRITEDKISIIWAYGEQDDLQSWPYGKRGEFNVLLINPDYTPQIDRDPVTDYPIAVHNPYHEEVRVWSIPIEFTMPTDDTTYWCTVHKAPRLTKKHHVIGFDVRFKDDASRRALHHTIVSKCNAPPGFSTAALFRPYLEHPGQLCYGAGGRSQAIQDAVVPGPILTEYCNEYLSITVVGGRINFMPPHVGTAIGDEEDAYYLLQAHYDNVDLVPDVTVGYSLDYYYTPQLRANEGQLMVVRHESPGTIPSHFIPPYSDDHANFGTCSSDCTKKILPKEGIRIYQMVLHGHNSGVGLRYRHFRGDRELPFISADDNWAFDYQQMHVMNRESHIQPGDNVVLECKTDTTNRTVVGGFSSRQEMCAAWYYYYNKMPNHMICTGEIRDQQAMEDLLGVYNLTWSTQDLEFLVRSPRRLSGLKVTDVSNMLDWTPEKRQALQRFQEDAPYQVRCPVDKSRRAHTTDRHGELVDLEQEEDDARPTLIPKPVRPYSRAKPCSSGKTDNANARGWSGSGGGGTSSSQHSNWNELAWF